MFNIDIDSLEIDLSQYDMHLPPKVSYKVYEEYLTDVPDGINEWILARVNSPELEGISHDYVSALMEFTAQVLLWRKGEL